MKKSLIILRFILLSAGFNLLKMDHKFKELLKYGNIEELNENNFIDFTFATEKIHKIIKKEKNLEKLLKHLELQNHQISEKGIN